MFTIKTYSYRYVHKNRRYLLHTYRFDNTFSRHDYSKGEIFVSEKKLL